MTNITFDCAETSIEFVREKVATHESVLSKTFRKAKSMVRDKWCRFDAVVEPWQFHSLISVSKDAERTTLINRAGSGSTSKGRDYHVVIRTLIDDTSPPREEQFWVTDRKVRRASVEIDSPMPPLMGGMEYAKRCIERYEGEVIGGAPRRIIDTRELRFFNPDETHVVFLDDTTDSLTLGKGYRRYVVRVNSIWMQAPAKAQRLITWHRSFTSNDQAMFITFQAGELSDEQALAA